MILEVNRANDTVWATRMRAAEKLQGQKLKSPATAGDSLNAGLVSSSQDGVHPRLEQTLRRHLDTRWSQPLHRPSIDTYRRLQDECSFTRGRPFVLDSGCGTGKSTQQLACQYPGHLVIGVDRSQARLAKSGMVQNGILQSPGRRRNCILLRAELTTFWRLLARDGHIPHKHFLLYPNPWPKPGHLKRRWHAHPVFPRLLALGGEIEMRCNWEIYALEFAQAVDFATGESVVPQKYQPRGYQPGDSASPFEQKYLERAQPLFSVIVPRRITAAFRHARDLGYRTDQIVTDQG
ncbi:MAG: hypothetical protein BMS9Abin30_0758 [Gammaproteobacteria bacterium]|nr:MAG: hypothetical protein BMS9Abin30_0758 [Gammaproteobacteria bacterium]